MSHDENSVARTARDLFAGVRVRDVATARAWYERLMGAAPSFFPNDIEAVWALGGHRWLYVLEDASRGTLDADVVLLEKPFTKPQLLGAVRGRLEDRAKDSV